MSRVLDGDECDCSCHESEGAELHGIPCCSHCPFCHKNIATGLKEHVDRKHEGAQPSDLHDVR